MKTKYYYLSNNFIEQLVNNIAKQFGPNCEVVFHDFNNYESSIMFIANGHVTGRKQGDTSTNRFFEEYFAKDFYRNPVYLNKTDEGHTLLCSTTYISEETKKIIGALCINYDITDLMIGKNSIEKLISAATDEQTNEQNEPNGINEMLSYYLHECQRMIGKPAKIMTKEEKLRAFDYLDKKQAFLIAKSSDKVCKTFGISKFTLYSYLEKLREDRNLTNE